MKHKLPWLLLAGLVGYLLIRRLGVRGGATDEEVDASLPGDEVIPHPMIETTHAITIQAPPGDVWPWLVQAGYRGSGRAGWYSDSWLDPWLEGVVFRLIVPPDKLPDHPGQRSASKILPEFQHIAVGDIVPDGPPDSAYFVVQEVEPERALVLYSTTHLQYMSPTFLRNTRWASNGDFTWVFVLEPLDGHSTRLVLRTRARFGPPLLFKLIKPIFYLGEALIPGQILRGIRVRAEAMARQS